ncbi:unnamed protein product [Rangifer tarandus platyrhynchus]|uniref:Uncharacterized protein n=2 Tax=Rangifer tarandus platyrhynchus TaxID=3082113 RepID=A0AC59YU70_RANTA|nr:unnamed protein product [Rangifer tarandus platyrhynchus]
MSLDPRTLANEHTRWITTPGSDPCTCRSQSGSCKGQGRPIIINNFAAGRSRKRDAFGNGAEVLRQWAVQSEQHRPMVGEPRNPRHHEPIGVDSPSQWEGQGGVL